MCQDIRDTTGKLYRLLRRYRAEGEAGLAPRSRRAHSQPRAVTDGVVEQIVALRSELTTEGLDAGALTIHWHLQERSGSAPSVSSIWRILRRRGLVAPQPRKRMKRYLAQQPPAGSLALLQAQLDAFRARYNDARPHRALGRATPRSVYETKVKAAPAARVESHFRVRYDKVDRSGKVTLRYASKLLHIGMGARFKGQKVVLLVADRDVRVLDPEDQLLRQLTLDPSRDYQRQSA